MYETIVNKTLPHALMIGVDYDLFWTLTPKTLSPFIKAFSLRQQYDDFLAWQQGKYIQLAVASNLSKDNKYPNEPLLTNVDFERKINKDVPNKKQDEIKRKFMERMIQLNSRFKKEV